MSLPDASADCQPADVEPGPVVVQVPPDLMPSPVMREEPGPVPLVLPPALSAAVEAFIAGRVKPVKKKRKLKPEESARRSKHIREFQHLGTAASAARPPEERSRTAGAGGKATWENYRAMKDVLAQETPEAIEKRRKDHEATRERILKSIVERAEEPDAAPGIVSLALRELREESDRLRELERVARLERANGIKPPVAAAPASPGISSGDISTGENSHVLPAVAAD